MKGLSQIVNNNIYVVPGASLVHIAPSNLSGLQRHTGTVSYPTICPSVPLRQALKDGEVNPQVRHLQCPMNPHNTDGSRGLPIS